MTWHFRNRLVPERDEVRRGRRRRGEQITYTTRSISVGIDTRLRLKITRMPRASPGTRSPAAHSITDKIKMRAGTSATAFTQVPEV